jgi:NADPH:quinone reductase-like Zn-dependent oxidoreductase
MRAVLMTAAGGPEVLKLADVEEPEITGPRDVRVRLRAAGINPVEPLREDRAGRQGSQSLARPLRRGVLGFGCAPLGTGHNA